MATNKFEGKKSKKLSLFGRIIKLVNAGYNIKYPSIDITIFFSATKLFSTATILQLEVAKRQIFKKGNLEPWSHFTH